MDERSKVRRNGESVEETVYLDDVLKSEFAEEDGTEDLEPGFGRLSACAEGRGRDGGVVEEDIEDEKIELDRQSGTHGCRWRR